MPIRLRPVLNRPQHAPAFLSANTWPGLWPWFLSVACSTAVFASLAGFAWRNANGRLSDMTTFLVAVPSAVFAMMLLMVILWAFVARIPVQAGLVFIARMLPIAWLVPIGDLIRSAGKGFLIPAVPFDGGGIFLAAFTGTLLPVQAALPMGMRLGIFATALLSAFVVWFSLRGRILGSVSVRVWATDAARSAVVGILVSMGLTLLTFFPSALGVWQGVVYDRALPEGIVATGHATLRAVTGGYWWTNLYDRFPSSVEAQADLATRLSASGFTVLALGILLITFCVLYIPFARVLVRQAYRSWSAVHLLIYAVGAAVITMMVAADTPMLQGTWWIALLMALFALGAFRLHTLLERCLSQAAASGEGADPFICEVIPSSLARQISFTACIYAIFAAFLLGWPILAALLVFLACAHLSRDRFWKAWPWTATAFRGVGAASLALSGFFFSSQSARFTGLAAFLMLLAACHRVGMEILYAPRKTPLVASILEEKQIP